MKQKIVVLIAVVCMSAGCVDLQLGSRFLDKSPGVDVTIDTVFNSKLTAERALLSAYATLRSGLTVYNSSWPYSAPTVDETNQLDGINADVLESLTDLVSSHCEWGGVHGMYYNAQYSASMENSRSSTKYGYNPHQDAAWTGIRKAFLFIDNVDRVPDMTECEKTIRKGEAYMIIACHYHELLRHFGGVPILDYAVDASNELGNDYSRRTVAQVGEYIVGLCDKAFSMLPWTVSAEDDGRFTGAGALALKCRVLMYLASPFFNSAQPYMAMGEPRGGNASKVNPADVPQMVWLGGYDASKWQDVAEACKAFFRENEAHGNPYRLVMPASNTAEDYRKAFSSGYADRNNGEILIATCRHTPTYRNMYHTIYFGCSTDEDGNTARGFGGGCVTLNFVDMFPNADGTRASYQDWISSHGHVGTLTDNPFTGRDPRLYESVMIVGDRFQDRIAEMWIGGEERGQENNLRAATGFCSRKFLWDYNGVTCFNKPSNYPYMRLAELYLIYAEALNETGDTQGAMRQLDFVRRRVGLPEMTGALLSGLHSGKELPSYDGLIGDPLLREEIIDERARELYFEESRWHDIVRWKREDIMCRTLYGIKINIATSDASGNVTSLDFSDPVEETARYWKKNWSPKWWLSAFPSDEINKGYGLVQNPGW